MCRAVHGPQPEGAGIPVAAQSVQRWCAPARGPIRRWGGEMTVSGGRRTAHEGCWTLCSTMRQKPSQAHPASCWTMSWTRRTNSGSQSVGWEVRSMSRTSSRAEATSSVCVRKPTYLVLHSVVHAHEIHRVAPVVVQLRKRGDVRSGSRSGSPPRGTNWRGQRLSGRAASVGDRTSCSTV